MLTEHFSQMAVGSACLTQDPTGPSALVLQQFVLHPPSGSLLSVPTTLIFHKPLSLIQAVRGHAVQPAQEPAPIIAKPE